MMYNETASHLRTDLKQYREHLSTMEREVSRAKAAIKLLEKTIKGLEEDSPALDTIDVAELFKEEGASNADQD
jgi:CII-binding regulator of phage lambda lysogenization HflD